MEQFMTPEFWVAVGQIIMIDILLGGDNAVVIALACRKLPPAQRTKGILWGTAGAIALRVILIFFALTLLAIPFLKLVGAALLLWIGIKLLAPDHDDAHGNIQSSDKLWGAVKTVIVADLVMSVDNVIAIAGAAQGAGQAHQMPLVIFGLLVSIPIIVWGSQLVIKLMDRFPIIITLGGMLLGWIAGTMAVSDPALSNTAAWTWVPKLPQTDTIRYAAGIAGALVVLGISKWVSHSARENWRAKWFSKVQAQLLPLLERNGGQVTPVLAKGPLADLTQQLKREHSATLVVDARRPKIGVDLEPVTPEQAPARQSGWAFPGAVMGMGALLVLANELAE